MEMISQRLVKGLVGILIAGLILVVLTRIPVLIFESLSQSLSIPTATLSPSHQIVSSDLQLREAWRRVIGPIYTMGVGHGPVIANGIIVLPIFGDNTRLVAFDLQNGQMFWSQKLVTPQYPDDPQSVDSLYVDTGRVYVAVPFVIRSFRLADGQPIWMTESLPGHAGYDIYPSVEDETIQVYSTLTDRLIYYINANDGDIRSIETYSRTLLFKAGAVEYHDDLRSLFSVDSATGNVLWRSTVKGPVRGWPVFVNPETMIVATGSLLKTISAVDLTSGQVMWRTPEASVTSNFVVVDDIVYSVTPGAALAAQDALTGRSIGQIQFSGGPLNATDANEDFVFADHSMLFVYFGDSQELIAFNQN